MIEIEKYARAAASTARTPPNSPARRAALEAENAARVAAEQFVKGLEAERDAAQLLADGTGADTYSNWLRAAYLYYITPGEDTGMSDATWDALSRKYFQQRDQMTRPEHAPLHRDEFTGGSLFWLRRDEYPLWSCLAPGPRG